MRKITVLLLAVLMLVIAVIPTSAQGTIADVAASDDNFSTLLSAVQAADPAILEALSGSGPLTVFAPTNAAFANLASFFDFELEALLADTALVTQLLQYHVIEGNVFSSAITDDSTVPTLLEGTAIGINILENGTIQLNGVAEVIEPFDVNASNGVVHAINDVIFPGILRDRLDALTDVELGGGEEAAEAEEEAAGPTIADVAAETESLSTLLTVVGAADPSVLETLSGEGEFTLFAPTNDAFAALFEMLGLGAEDVINVGGAELLTPVLLYHVVPGVLNASDLVGMAGSDLATALDGEMVMLTLTDDGLTLNETINTTRVNIEASNGIIHLINGVLLPQQTIAVLEGLGLLGGGEEAAAPEEETAAEEEAAGPTIADVAAGAENLSTLVELIGAADPSVLETLSGEGDFTVFAPTNEAFETLFAQLGLGVSDVISLGGAELITPVLLYHVVPGAMSASDLTAMDGSELATALEGEMVLVTLTDDGLTLNGEATTISVNIEATNGTIHIINGVLLPQQTIQVLQSLGLL